jgi:hypothetical protein
VQGVLEVGTNDMFPLFQPMTQNQGNTTETETETETETDGTHGPARQKDPFSTFIVGSALNSDMASQTPDTLDPNNARRRVHFTSEHRFCLTPKNCLPALSGRWFLFIGDSVSVVA